MVKVVGWDIGGAHLKAARSEEGRIVAAVQVAAPLRFGLERLSQSFAEAKAQIGNADRHLITMTGELADTFSSRTEGVLSLTAAAVRELGDVTVYAGRAGFISPEDVGEHVADIASANWFASASVVAKTIGSALFIDLGSTTTDIIPVVNGQVAARGYTDAERLASGELVYTGLVRGFIMAAADKAPFAGRWSSLVRENFSTMADAHRILGTLPEGADQMMTADGREKTIEASEARLARMIGRDRNDADAGAWMALAQWFVEAQIRAISDGAMLVLSQGQLSPEAPLVVAGIGVSVLREVARRLGRKCVGFDSVIDAVPIARSAAAASAPAAALALLGSAPAGTGRPP
ncbi:MAG TPA: hydantoinase/oxoprolinase family protein [Pseudolabrys sp.]|jgi:probable H4MPT-linked C1 transfer pathway protein|nr:hydantoinase/oxoprolinase family protein [Pseudolabrys sp.]